MSEEIFIPEIVTSTPYVDHEQPSIRFDVKKNEDVNKHLLFYKTNKRKVFQRDIKHQIFYLICLKKFKHFQK